MPRINLSVACVLLVLGGCGGSPEPGAAPPPSAASAAGSGYLRITSEVRPPQMNVTLMPGEVYPRAPFSGHAALVGISVFGTDTRVHRSSVEDSFWTGGDSYGPDFLSEVRSARAGVASQLACMRSTDMEKMAVLPGILTAQALLPIFRRYRVQPAAYGEIEAETEPERVTGRYCAP